LHRPVKLVSKAPHLDDDWRARKVREWLFLLLCFAITHDERDHAAAIGMAEEIDSLGLYWTPSGPRFFVRTSRDVCRALRQPQDPTTIAILRRHAQRIDHTRLRAAFEAATGLACQSASSPSRAKLGRSTRGLWRGLGGA
jgi:hypothetical protein